MEYAIKNTDTELRLSTSSTTSSAKATGTKIDSYIKDNTFVPINNPYEMCYLSATTKIDLSDIPEFDFVGSVSNQEQELIFSEDLQKREVPTSWLTWSEPPYSESSTPQVLFSRQDELIISLSKPSRVFGLEIEPDSFGVYWVSVEFYGQGELLGRVSRDTSGRGGARLFAAVYSNRPFDTIKIIAQQGSNGFAIAQLRYGDGLDCSLYCNTNRCIPFEAEICADKKIIKAKCPELKDCQVDVVIEDGKCFSKPKCNIKVCNEIICADLPCVPVDIIYVNGKGLLLLSIDTLLECNCSTCNCIGCNNCQHCDCNGCYKPECGCQKPSCTGYSCATYTSVVEVDINQVYVNCSETNRCENVKLVLKDICAYLIECNCKILIKGVVEVVCCDL